MSDGPQDDVRRCSGPAAAADARDRQDLPRRARTRRRRPGRPTRRGALPARPERRRQVHADQGARRGAPARRGRDPLAGRARSPSPTRTPRSPSGSPRSTRSSTWSPGSPWPRTSSSGTRSRAAGCVKRAETRKAARALLARLGHSEIRADREVGTLPASGQQIVSMARALSHDTRLIVMDEPSAALDQQEVQTLFRVIRDLTAQGVAVVYISHRLEEIRQVGDRVTVLKDGRTVATDLPAKTTADLRADPADDRPRHRVRLPATAPTPTTSAATVLEVSDLSLHKVFADVSFTVAAGEIVGLAGLVGLGAVGDPRSGVRRPQAVQRHRDASTASGSAQARSVPRSRRASAWPPRSARARACCSTSRSTRTSPSPASAGSRGPGSSTASAERASALEWTQPLDVRPRRGHPAGAHPVRRQPAEGRAGPVAAARLPGAAARRADPRRRRGRAQRDLRAHPLAGRARAGRGRRVQRGRGGPRSGRPRPRRSAKGASCTAARPPRSTSTGSSTW